MKLFTQYKGGITMKREEEIAQIAKQYYNPKSVTIFTLQMRFGFITGAQWADETIVEKMCKWLENNIDKYAMVLHSIDSDELEEHVVLTESFKEDFMKVMEE